MSDEKKPEAKSRPPRLNATQVALTSCPRSSWMSWRPVSASRIHTVPPSLAAASHRPSGLNVTLYAVPLREPSWPGRGGKTSFCVVKSQTRTVLSALAEARRRPSVGLNATLKTDFL